MMNDVVIKKLREREQLAKAKVTKLGRVMI